MADRSNEPRTIVIAGVAMIVMGIVAALVVWWLVAGILAGVQSHGEVQHARARRDVAVYTGMLDVVAAILGAASLGLLGAGSVIVWKGLRKSFR